jgi:hypothetical protein
MGFYVKQINNLHAPDGALSPCKNVNVEIQRVAKRTDASKVGNLPVEIEPLLLPRAGIHWAQNPSRSLIPAALSQCTLLSLNGAG